MSGAESKIACLRVLSFVSLSMFNIQTTGFVPSPIVLDEVLEFSSCVTILKICTKLKIFT